MKHLLIIEVDIHVGRKIWRYRRGNQKNHQELQNSRYQPWKVICHVFVCSRYRFCLFLQLWYLILEWIRLLGMFCFYFITRI